MFTGVLRYRDRCGANDVMVKILTVVAVLAASGLVSRPVGAAPIYQLDHFNDAAATVLIATVGPQGTPINYIFPFQQVNDDGGNFSEAAGQVGTGFVGLFNRTESGPHAPQGQEIDGTFMFDVFFASSGSDPIDVIMNMELAGTVAPNAGIYSRVEVRAGLVATPFGGSYLEIAPPSLPLTIQDGILSSFIADGTVQSISGLILDVPVNQPVQFMLKLLTGNPHADFSSAEISFGNTLSLATSGNVFDLLGPNAGDITSVTSSDANIVNNSFAIPIPEPSSALHLALGALGLLGYARRRRS